MSSIQIPFVIVFKFNPSNIVVKWSYNSCFLPDEGSLERVTLKQLSIKDDSTELITYISLFYHQGQISDLNKNKTGLQPVSRPEEKIVGFFSKRFKKVQKTVSGRCVHFMSISFTSILSNFNGRFETFNVF